MKRWKKVCAVLGITGFALGSLGSSAYAENYTIDYWSPRTYVKSFHEGGWSYAYKGVVSICGADRDARNGKFYYPVRSWIVYMVPGRAEEGTSVRSSGPKDSRTKTDTIIVQDSPVHIWTKTRVDGGIEDQRYYPTETIQSYDGDQ